MILHFMNKVFFFFLSVVLANLSSAQCLTPFDYGFLTHLKQERLTTELELYLKEYQNDVCKNDTALYELGVYYFSLKQFSQANSCFHQITESSVYFKKAIIYLTISHVIINQYVKADSALHSLTNLTDEEQQLKWFYHSMIALHKEDTALYRMYDTKITDTLYWFHEARLYIKYELYPKIAARQKSVWLAGGLSMLVPGLGKVYAGRKYEGLSSFLQNGALFGIAFENINRSGLGSARSILFTGIASVFYLGNIYGSIKAVKTNKRKKVLSSRYELENQMHIVLRNYLQ